MSYFRKTPKVLQQLEMLKRDQKWLIVINADPDAMASAMALRRIMSTRVTVADIAKINEISRPDNLAMIRYTRLHMVNYTPELRSRYTHFAMVDSQPSHSPQFAGIPFSLIIDPSSVILSGAMMLEHMGWDEAAERIHKAMNTVLAGRRVTTDLARLMDNASTVGCSEFGELLGAAL